MPIYEYMCTVCGVKFEHIEPYSEEKIIDCKHCRSPCKRLFFPTPIIFKGKGFYTTDNRNAQEET